MGSKAPMIVPYANICMNEVIPLGELANATSTCQGDSSTPDNLAFSAVVNWIKGEVSASAGMMTSPFTTLG